MTTRDAGFPSVTGNGVTRDEGLTGVTGKGERLMRSALIAVLVLPVALAAQEGCPSDWRWNSIGVATFPTDGRTATELIACADRRLYQVKRDGGHGRATGTDGSTEDPGWASA